MSPEPLLESTHAPEVAARQTLAALIATYGAGDAAWDRDFCRRLAAELHAVSDRLVFEPLERLGLVDVAITLRLERDVDVVVTGRVPDVPGELTLRWSSADLDEIIVRLAPSSLPDPALLCTLDGSWRGRSGRIVAAVHGTQLAPGQAVRARALATIGDRTEVRVEAGGRGWSVPPASVRWDDEPTARASAALALLARHVPLDAQERGHADAIAALLRRGEAGELDPFARTTFAPGHITASAFLLSADLRSVLLVWHTTLRRWLQPGGHVEPGDPDVVAAALREVEEETALRGCTPLGDGLFDVDVHAIPPRTGKRVEPGHEHFDLRIALVVPEDATAVAGDGVSEVRWIALDAFDALVASGELETDASVLRAVERLRRHVGAGHRPGADDRPGATPTTTTRPRP